jgi:hypothetical protein
MNDKSFSIISSAPLGEKPSGTDSDCGGDNYELLISCGRVHSDDTSKLILHTLQEVLKRQEPELSTKGTGLARETRPVPNGGLWVTEVYY